MTAGMESIDRSSYFYQDLIYEVLLNLPVKSLLRFKCISKDWFASISHPQFIESHYQKSTEMPYSLRHRKLLALTSKNILSLKGDRIFKEILFDSSNFDSPDVGFPLDDGYLSSCKGLVCVRCITYRDIYIWNPATRCERKLPKSPYLINCPLCYSTSVTFGYDQSSDDYKVIRQFAYIGKNVAKYWFEVFSLKAGTWKSIETPDDKFKIQRGLAAYLNGAIHWPLIENQVISGTVGVFDLDTERFSEFLLPENFILCSKAFDLSGFDVLEGCLCALVRNKKKCICELWMMKEYKVKESWTKLLCLPWGACGQHTFRIFPQFISEIATDALILPNRWCHYIVMVFNFQHTTTRTILGDCLSATMHVESLVSSYGSNVIDAADHQHHLQQNSMKRKRDF